MYFSVKYIVQEKNDLFRKFKTRKSISQRAL